MARHSLQMEVKATHRLSPSCPITRQGTTFPDTAEEDHTRQDELHETPDFQGTFPRLDEEQLRILSAVGERRPTEMDEVLFREGDESYPFVVVLAGKVETMAEERRVGVHALAAFSASSTSCWAELRF